MPTFVPGHDYDVFISYAHCDNGDGALDDQHGWVFRFKKHLERILSSRCPGVRIFFDNAAITGNGSLDQQLVDAAGRSATLVVILSQVYLTRPYCNTERDQFCRRAGDDASAAERLFLVHYDDVAVDDRPPLLKIPRGYEFFHRDPEKKHLRYPLDNTVDPLPEGPFKRQIYDLCGELEGRLKIMLRQASQPGSATAPAVFLADATPDLRGNEDRDAVASALAKAGFRVLPAAAYDRGNLTAYKEAVKQDLAQALLFVQVLGDSGSPGTPELPLGFEGLQFELAKQAGKPCLRWHPADLNLEKIAKYNARHHRYLTNADVPAGVELLSDERVQAGFLNNFCLAVEEKLRTVVARQSKPTPTDPKRPAVLLSPASHADRTIGVSFGERIEEGASTAVEALIVDAADSLLKQYQNESSLVVICGNGDGEWIEKRVSECREIALNNRDDAPICAVYVGPPPLKSTLPKMPIRFKVIHHDNPAEVEAYLVAVSEKMAKRSVP